MDQTQPILLIPGLGGSPRIYAPVIPQLWRFGAVTSECHVRRNGRGDSGRQTGDRSALRAPAAARAAVGCRCRVGIVACFLIAANKPWCLPADITFVVTFVAR